MSTHYFVIKVYILSQGLISKEVYSYAQYFKKHIFKNIVYKVIKKYGRDVVSHCLKNSLKIRVEVCTANETHF